MQTHSREYPQLMDLVAADSTLRVEPTSTGYSEHLPVSEVLKGLREKRYLRGTLRAKREGPHCCYVVVHSDEDGARQSVNITGKLQVNRAIDGDLVAIEIISGETSAAAAQMEEEEKQDRETVSGASVAEETAEATVEAVEGLSRENGGGFLQGRVVGIIRRNWKSYAGSLDPSSRSDGKDGDSDNVQFIPVDKKIPRIWINTRRFDELREARLLVSIDHWPTSSDLPLGHYTSVLGTNGDKGVETQVLLHEFDVPHEEFSAAVMACLPPADWAITPEVVAQRTDLRHLPVVSIDPPGCKDIDDALHCIRLPNGRLQAGVHIAGKEQRAVFNLDLIYYC